MGNHSDMKAFFDALADSWDENVDPAVIRRILASAGLRAGHTVLDVGSGTGVLLPFLLEAVGPEGRVFALDISPAMLQRSKSKGLKRVEYICAPAEAIPLDNNTCDAVVCYNAFPHFADKQAAVKEMSRVLVPGGTLVIAHGQSREEVNELHRHMNGPVHDDYLPDDETMMHMLKAVALTNIQICNGPSGYMLLAVKPGP